MKPHGKFIAVALIIGWFLGAASGFVIMHMYRMTHGEHMGHARDLFFKRLNLSTDQKTQIEAIIQDTRNKLNVIFSETKPQVEAIRSSARSQIRAVLTPQQQVIFDKLDAKIQKRFEQRFERLLGQSHDSNS